MATSSSGAAGVNCQNNWHGPAPNRPRTTTPISQAHSATTISAWIIGPIRGQIAGVVAARTVALSDGCQLVDGACMWAGGESRWGSYALVSSTMDANVAADSRSECHRVPGHDLRQGFCAGPEV